MADREELKAEVITAIDGIQKIEAGWRGLHEKNNSLSIFTSYDFIRTTCQFFMSPADTPFIVALYARGGLAAVFPLCLVEKRGGGIPYTAVEHLGCRQGYNPGISTIIEEKEAWEGLRRVLDHAGSRWHVLQLGEMRREQLLNLPWLNDPRFSCFMLHDRIGFQVDLRGSFEEYLAARTGSTRRDYRKNLRFTEQRLGTPELCEYTGKSAAEGGFDRFIEIERKSYKIERGIAVTANLKRVSFYRSLCEALARTDSVRVYIWKVGGRDLAGTIVFIHGSRVYGMEIAFDREFGAMAPAIVLRAEVFRRFFGRGFNEFDMLGMHPSYGVPIHKRDWATSRTDTFKFSAVAKRSRLMPWLWLQKYRKKEGLIPLAGKQGGLTGVLAFHEPDHQT